MASLTRARLTAPALRRDTAPSRNIPWRAAAMRMRPIRTLWGLAIFLAVIGAPNLSAQGSDPAAIAAIKAQAARNDPDALFALAIILEVGREEPRTVPEAVRLLERAAALGHAPAKTQLGLMSQ